MSCTKDLLMEVSYATGCDGLIDTGVCDMAEEVARLLSARITAEKSDLPEEYQAAVDILRAAEGTETYRVYSRVLAARRKVTYPMPRSRRMFIT